MDKAAISRLQLTVIILCFSLNVHDGFDVVAISYAAPSISTDWSISPATLGAVFSAGLIGMTLGAMFLAPLTDVIGRRRMILAAMVVVAVTMALSSLANAVWQLMLLRCLTGLGIGSMLASLTALVAEYTPRRRRNFAIGFLQTGYPVGATIGGFIAAWVLPEYGWRGLFLLGGILTAAMILLVLIWLPESVDFLIKRRPPNALERLNVILEKMNLERLDRLPEPGTEALAPARLSSLMQQAHRGRTFCLWSAFFLTFFTLYFLLSWIPKIFVDAGFRMEDGISAGITFNAGAILGVLALGYVADKKGLRELIALFCVLGGAFMVVFGLISEGLYLLLILTFFIGAFVDGGFAGLYSVAARIYPAEIRTTGIGWAIGAGRLGGIAGPYVGGLLAAAGWSTGATFFFFAVPMAFAAYAVMAIQSRELQVARA